MPKPSDYTPARRRTMQVVVWLILLGTIGLAVLDTDVATEGEKVQVALGDGTSPATVAPLSILDPQKRRPRD